MRIPFTKRRARDTARFVPLPTADLLRALQYSRGNRLEQTARVTAVTALEIAAGEIGRALASARVSKAEPAWFVALHHAVHADAEWQGANQVRRGYPS